jgi:N-acetylglutamate synthase-like GNAT family acetyltransferase
MSSSNYRVRRATLEDVTVLMELWKSMKYPADELARRITEFQVAEAADGKVLGAVGLQMAQRQGRIHSEAFGDFSVADHVRPLLWDRLNALAANHGLLRLWSQEQAPFWSHCGLVKADPEALEKLPEGWRGSPGSWLTLKLKEDIAEVISADKEFAMYMAAEKERTARAMQQAKMLKAIATLVALVVLALVMAGGFLLLRHNPRLLQH